MLTPSAISEANLTDEEASTLAVAIDSVQSRVAAHTRLATAKSSAREAMRLEADAYAEHLLASPAPTRLQALRAAQAAYRGDPEPAKSNTHPKKAIAGPRIAWEKSKEVTAAAQDELQAAMNAATRAEKAEGAAFSELLRLCPPPSQESIARQYQARGLAERAEAVANPPPPKPAPKYQSELDRIAANRGKQRGPLLSNVRR